MICRSKTILTWVFCWHIALASAQQLSSVSTRWSDSFVEWDIFAYETDSTGTVLLDEDTEEPLEYKAGGLQLRWLNLRDDWSEWDYELGDERGTIKMKWKDDPTQWELRSYDGNIVTMRASWANDPTEWRITNNAFSLTLRSRWTNQLDEWSVQDANRGNIKLYTFRRQDPRDWAIEDQLVDEVSNSMRLAIIFIVLFHSTPRM